MSQTILPTPDHESELTEEGERPADAERSRSRANDLNGRDWTRFSISVWRDVKKSSDERAFGHPAMFPGALVDRLIQMFTREGERVIVDPFSGSGSTVVAARKLGGQGIGFELSDEYLELTRKRLGQGDMFAAGPEPILYQMDARLAGQKLAPESVDLVITSPPYWDILNQKRTADYKDVRHYGNLENDLGTVSDYREFLDQLKTVWSAMYSALKRGSSMIVNVMDLRKGPRFIPFHMDVCQGATEVGFDLDDIIIWDRGAEYNNLRALGYPSVMRINKVHEFLLIFKKL